MLNPRMLLLLLLFAGRLGRATPTIRQYTGSARVLQNPDRGFRHQFGNADSQVRQHSDLCAGHISPADLAQAAAFNLTVAQAYCFLPTANGRAVPVLSKAFLARLNASFALMRAHGVKALLRFLYDHDSPGENDYDFETIAGHIDQLTPVVRANADQLYALQAGFIGAWGEWHGSKRGLEYNATGISDMVRRELYTLLPPDRKLQLRVPEYKSQLVLRPSLPHPPPGGAGREEEDHAAAAARALAGPPADQRMAFGVAGPATPPGTAVARIGFDNDGFMSTSNDGWTWPSPNEEFAAWGEPATAEVLPLGRCGSWAIPLGCSDHGAMPPPGFSYAEAEAPYVPIDGEMYWNAGAHVYEAGWPVLDGHTAAWRLRAMHYDTLSLVHGYYPFDGPAPPALPNETISAWTREPLRIARLRKDRLPISKGYAAEAAARPSFSTFDYIRDHLGYRLEVAAASFPREVAAAGPLTFAADIVNYGFAAPVNPRPVQLVLLQHHTRPGDYVTSFEEVWRSPSLANPTEWRPRAQYDPTYQLTRHRIAGTFALALPAAAAGQNLTLALALPDARQHALDHRGSIRLANADTEWLVVGNEGFNVLGTILRA